MTECCATAKAKLSAKPRIAWHAASYAKHFFSTKPARYFKNSFSIAVAGFTAYTALRTFSFSLWVKLVQAQHKGTKFTLFCP